MNEPYQAPALNAPPIPHVGKTGYYIRTGRTIYRFPEFVSYGEQIIRGSRLPHRASAALRRSWRSKYFPHVGKKQLSKKAIP
jgi:hypothetical protein